MRYTSAFKTPPFHPYSISTTCRRWCVRTTIKMKNPIRSAQCWRGNVFFLNRKELRNAKRIEAYERTVSDRRAVIRSFCPKETAVLSLPLRLYCGSHRQKGVPRRTLQRPPLVRGKIQKGKRENDTVGGEGKKNASLSKHALFTNNGTHSLF